ncbi:hypothetical protein IKL64_00455 [bacterium]|nr:hypothetical protein [bacterium]
MDIFYINKSEFLKSINRESLEYFSDGREYSSEEKYFEHLCGLFLVNFIAKSVYEIDNIEIERVGKKPFLKGRELFFSISHSKDIIAVVFNNSNVGLDIEFIQNRPNFEAIMERFGKKVDNPTPEDFYKFWTFYEAEYKLDTEVKSVFSSKIENDYMLTCVSDDPLVSTFVVKKMVLDGENINLQNEFEVLDKCQFILSVE